jgi:hypothetical protein
MGSSGAQRQRASSALSVRVALAETAAAHPQKAAAFSRRRTASKAAWRECIVDCSKSSAASSAVLFLTNFSRGALASESCLTYAAAALRASEGQSAASYGRRLLQH